MNSCPLHPNQRCNCSIMQPSSSRGSEARTHRRAIPTRTPNDVHLPQLSSISNHLRTRLRYNPYNQLELGLSRRRQLERYNELQTHLSSIQRRSTTSVINQSQDRDTLLHQQETQISSEENIFFNTTRILIEQLSPESEIFDSVRTSMLSINRINNLRFSPSFTPLLLDYLRTLGRHLNIIRTFIQAQSLVGEAENLVSEITEWLNDPIGRPTQGGYSIRISQLMNDDLRLENGEPFSLNNNEEWINSIYHEQRWTELINMLNRAQNLIFHDTLDVDLTISFSN